MRIYNRRLATLEKAARSVSECAVIARMVQDGKLYDELNDSEKNAYSAYYGVSRKALEDCNTAVLGTLHFALHEKVNDELQAAICKVEQLALRKGNE